MDYEKKYKAVLNTATQWIKDGCTDKEKICLECVFPQLRESEDERIRQQLLWLCDEWEHNPERRTTPADIDNIKQIRRYLEKQKEQKPTEWSKSDIWAFNLAISIINGNPLSRCGNDLQECITRLKGIRDAYKPRPSWKPSEEQMKALRNCTIPGTTFDIESLKSLYEQLKKL